QVVRVDRCAHPPVPGGGTITIGGGAVEAPVAHAHQAVGDHDVECGAFGLIALMVLARVPHAGAEPLARHGHPRVAAFVGLPDPAAVPGWVARLTRLAVVVHGDEHARAGGNGGGQVHPHHIAFAREVRSGCAGSS